jgi:hypothetical protein
MRIVAGVGDLVQRIGDGRTSRILGDWTIGRSVDAVSTLHHSRTDEERGFLGCASKPKWDGLSVVWPQNHWDGFLWFDLKTGGDSFLWFGLKIGGNSFFWFSLKTGGDGFSVWASKPTAMIW